MNNVQEIRHIIAHPSCGELKYMTREEFLHVQERSSIAYEYVNGVIRQIDGPTLAHCLLTQNFCQAIRARLRGSQCEVFSSGVQLNLTLRNDEVVYRPDLFVACQKN